MRIRKCKECGKGFEVFYKIPEDEFVCVVCKHKPKENQGRLTQEARHVMKVTKTAICIECGHVFTEEEDGDCFSGWNCPYCTCVLCASCMEEEEEVHGLDFACPSCKKIQ